MSGPRLRGHRPDTFDAKDIPYAKSKIAALPPMIAGGKSIDYSQDLDQVLLQLTGSCVGCGLSSSAFMRGVTSGMKIRRPSHAWIYAVGRMLERASPDVPLTDDGSLPRLAILGANLRGLVAEETWVETEDANVVPPLDAVKKAENATIKEYSRIPDGAGATDAAIDALRRGVFPTFAMQVTKQYEDLTGDVYDGDDGPSLGGHDQMVIGYSAVLDALKILGSWGKDFGTDGFAWISRRFFDASTADKWCIDLAAPEGSVQ